MHSVKQDFQLFMDFSQLLNCLCCACVFTNFASMTMVQCMKGYSSTNVIKIG